MQGTKQAFASATATCSGGRRRSATPLFAVTYEHPDEEGWRTQLMPHVAWLNARVEDGSLLASGPFPEAPVKAALLILRAADRPTLDALIASDPFAVEGLIANMTVRAWDPIFGAFNAQSSMPRG